HSDVPRTFPLAIRAGAPVPDWPTGRVTLLGDAVHATTPVGGTGANTALRDAALLSTRLREVARGRSDLIAAGHGYETERREDGSTAVARSLSGAEKIFRANPAEFHRLTQPQQALEKPLQGLTMPLRASRSSRWPGAGHPRQRRRIC